MKSFITFSLVLILSIITGSVIAEDAAIVAMVDGKPITEYEFLQRKKLIVSLFNIDLSPDGVERNVERSIIHDMIRCIVVKNNLVNRGLVVDVSEKELEDIMRSWEDRLKLNKGGMRLYLKKHGVDVQTLKTQWIDEKAKQNLLSSIAHGIQVKRSAIESAVVRTTNADLKVKFLLFSTDDTSTKKYLEMLALKSKLLGCERIDGQIYRGVATMKSFDKTLKTLDKRMMSVIEDTDEGTASTVFQHEGRFNIVCLCSKTVYGLAQSDSEKLYTGLLVEQASLQAERIIKNMQHKSSIEILRPELR